MRDSVSRFEGGVVCLLECEEVDVIGIGRGVRGSREDEEDSRRGGWTDDGHRISDRVATVHVHGRIYQILPCVLLRLVVGGLVRIAVCGPFKRLPLRV